MLYQVGIAPDDQAAANRDDFDTARVAGNARTHGPPRPHTGRCGGLSASSGSRGSETTLGCCAALFGEWLVTNNLSDTNQAERAAAMWGAANQDDFDTARAAGNARTHTRPGPIQAAVVASPHLADVGQ